MKFLRALGAFLVWSVVTIHGMLVTALFLLVLAVGGYIHSIWSSSPLWLFFLSIGITVIAMIVAFVAIPLIVEFEEEHED